MLYDPKWEAKTKADPFKLETLIAWLEKQPATGAYDFMDQCGKCLFGRYMEAHGVPWEYGPSHQKNTYNAISRALGDRVAVGFPWTFGAALDRARKRLAAAE